jgi:transcriptional regulator with XRE-family HTH domain
MPKPNLNQRVAWAILNVKKKTGLTWPELAQKLGSDKNTLAAYAREKGLIMGRVIERLVSEFGLSAAWLVTGQGEAYPYEEGRLETDGPPMLPARPASGSGAGLRRLPWAWAELAPGGEKPLLMENDEEPYAFAGSWLAGFDPDPGPLFLSRVPDNAMTPTLQPGDTVMIHAGRRKLQSGNIYAFTPKDGVMQMRRLESRGRRIGVLADNRDLYAAYELDRDQVRLIGRVVWLARRLP